MLTVAKAEQPVLEKLIQLRQRLQLLNKDRTKYIKSEDVDVVYQEFILEVNKLNEVREQPIGYREENRLDAVLDDVFQLLSLCFMSAGKNYSSPSVYVQAATIKVCVHCHRVLIRATTRPCFRQRGIYPSRHRPRPITARRHAGNNPE
jgi:hypothetical protein